MPAGPGAVPRSRSQQGRLSYGTLLLELPQIVDVSRLVAVTNPKTNNLCHPPYSAFVGAGVAGRSIMAGGLN